MLLGDLLRHIGLEFGFDQTASSDEQLLMIDWANDAVLDLLLEVGIKYGSTTLNLVAGTSDYTLAATVLMVKAAKYNALDGRQVELIQRSLQDIMDYREFSSVANDTPRYFAHDADQIWLYPTPSAADTITLTIIPEPTLMSAVGNDPANATYGGIPNEYHPALLAYMRWRGALYDERQTPHTPDQYRTFYDQELIRVRKRVRKRGGRRMSPARVGYPGGTNFPHRNDTYPDR